MTGPILSRALQNVFTTNQYLDVLRRACSLLLHLEVNVYFHDDLSIPKGRDNQSELFYSAIHQRCRDNHNCMNTRVRRFLKLPE